MSAYDPKRTLEQLVQSQNRTVTPNIGPCIVMIGGSARTFALQPISLEGSIAVNVALGVSGLKLRPVL
jgi:hypothetical protein